MPVSARSSASRCPMTSSWKPRACRSIAASGCAGCRTCRWRRGSGWAVAAAISSSTAPKACGAAYVVEIPGAGALNVERHLYEKVVLVVEGRGSTEVWQEGQTKRHVFEWQKGSLFTIPLNAFHRFINAASAPALLLCGTTAPNVMNLIDNPDFIFDCPHSFSERFSGADDFFKPSDDIEPDPMRGLAMRRTNLIPDIVNYRAAARQPPLARLPARRAGRWPATGSICGSASTRPGAIRRRTSMPPPRCSSASRARATPIRGRKRSAPRRGRTARPTRCCGRITSRSAWSRPRR